MRGTHSKTLIAALLCMAPTAVLAGGGIPTTPPSPSAPLDSVSRVLLAGVAITVVGILIAMAWVIRRSFGERDKLRATLANVEAQAEALEAKTEALRVKADRILTEDARRGREGGTANYTATRSAPVEVPADLIEAAAHSSVIVFVGASGLVRNGAPTQREFLEQIVARTGGDHTSSRSEQPSLNGPSSHQRHRDQITRLLGRGDYDAATDLIESEIGRDALVAMARSAYADVHPAAEFERLCRGVAVDGFVSLGFDRAVLDATGIEGARIYTARSSSNLEQVMTGSGRFVLQLGGDLAQAGTVCFTQAELYATLAEAADLRSVLLSLLSARTVVFVGMTMAEIETLWQAVGLFEAPSQRHFALLEGEPDFDLMADRLASRYRTVAVEIDGRGDLGTFADRLASAVRRRRDELDASGEASVGRPVRLQQISLHNIGPFSSATVDLSRAWTVILGNNGAGKSTILRAIAMALAGTDREAARWASTLLKCGQKFGTIELIVDTMPQPSTYKVQLSLEGDRVNVSSAVSPLQAGALKAFGFTAIRGVVLPDTMEPATVTADRLARVSDVMPLLRGGIDSRVQDLRAWIRQTYNVQQASDVGPAGRERAKRMLDTFFGILDALAPGFAIGFSRCDRATGEILINTLDGEIPLSYVSQGMASMIGWLGTLIERLYAMGGDDSDPRKASALLLIDEIDSHLHPEWQQRLVSTVRKAFPNLQVVATTHSALMVGSLEAREVVKVNRIGSELAVEQITRSYKGYRVDQILTDPPFGLDSTRDRDWEELRTEYAGLLGTEPRDGEQEARYRDLHALMESIPPPYEDKADRDAYASARDRLGGAIARKTTAIGPSRP